MHFTRAWSDEPWVLSCDPAFSIPEKFIAKIIEKAREYSLNIISDPF